MVDPQRGPTVGAPGRFVVGSIDDHEVVQVALRAALGPSSRLRLGCTAASVDAFLAQRVRCDLVLLDLRLSDGSSPAENVKRLAGTGCAVVAFTSAESPYLTRLAVHAGVAAVIRKSQPVATVLAILEAAAAGRPVLTAEEAHAMESDPQLPAVRLSDQETRVLTLFADGEHAPAVAAELGITVGTLEDYVRRIRNKYARAGRPATTKVDLYKRAVEDGLLPGPTRQ